MVNKIDVLYQIRDQIVAAMVTYGEVRYTIDKQARQGETSDFTAPDGSLVALGCYLSCDMRTNDIIMNLWEPMPQPGRPAPHGTPDP